MFIQVTNDGGGLLLVNTDDIVKAEASVTLPGTSLLLLRSHGKYEHVRETVEELAGLLRVVGVRSMLGGPPAAIARKLQSVPGVPGVRSRVDPPVPDVPNIPEAAWGFTAETRAAAAATHSEPPPARRHDGFPRRQDLTLMTPAERAIYDAVQAVEAAGAHPWLTDAVALLQTARDRVADYVELPTTPRT